MARISRRVAGGYVVDGGAGARSYEPAQRPARRRRPRRRGRRRQNWKLSGPSWGLPCRERDWRRLPPTCGPTVRRERGSVRAGHTEDQSASCGRRPVRSSPPPRPAFAASVSDQSNPPAALPIPPGVRQRLPVVGAADQVHDVALEEVLGVHELGAGGGAVVRDTPCRTLGSLRVVK